MTAGLFRREAVEAQRTTPWGGILQARQPTWRLLTAAALLGALAIVSFAMWGQFTRKEHVSGYVAPTTGLIKVYTPQAGIVVERHVSEGQVVRQGDVLLVISSERATASTREAHSTMVKELRARRESLQQERSKQSSIDALAANGLTDRIRSLNTELQAAKTQVQLQQGRVASAQTMVKRYERLVADRFMSEAALQQKQDEMLEVRNQLAAAERNVTALIREINTARLDLAAGDLQRANNSAAFDRQISELEQQTTEADARRTVVLAAPAAGTVTTILVEVGQSTSPGTPLLSLLPAGAEMEAHLLVPTRAAGFIKSGQEVALRYEAFPYQRFGHHIGQVKEVGRTVIQPNETPLPVANREPVYLVKVALPAQQMLAYGQPLALRAGMALDADVRIDRRRIIQWIFDPVLSVSGRV